MQCLPGEGQKGALRRRVFAKFLQRDVHERAEKVAFFAGRRGVEQLGIAKRLKGKGPQLRVFKRPDSQTTGLPLWPFLF